MSLLYVTCTYYYNNNITPLSSSWSLRTTLQSSPSSQDRDESAYRQEVEQLAVWCGHNNLELNTLKTVEMIVDFRKNPPALPPLTIMNSTVTAVESFRFLGTTISQDLKWDNHIDYWEKGPAETVFPPPAKDVQPATGAAERVLLCHHRDCPVFIYNCLVWFNYQNRHQKTTMDSQQDCWEDYRWPSELYTSRLRKRVKKITLDPSQPAHSLFELLPSDQRYRALSTKTARHKNSFHPRPYPTWTTHSTPQYCTSVNNSSTLHLYIGHMHIQFCYFYFLYIFILLLLLFIILYSLHYYCFITLIICCLHYVCAFCTGSS